jgi:hypothetical protein
MLMGCSVVGLVTSLSMGFTAPIRLKWAYPSYRALTMDLVQSTLISGQWAGGARAANDRDRRD